MVILKATELAAKWYEESGIVCDNNSIRARVIDWYSHTAIDNPVILAGLALEGDYVIGLSYQEMKNISKKYFR